MAKRETMQGWRHITWTALKTVMWVTTLMVAIAIVGCSDRAVATAPAASQPAPPPKTVLTPEASATKLTAPPIVEVSPPQAIQALQAYLEGYQPQVTILSPKPDEVLTDDTVTVRFQVKDLPIFQDKVLGMGPHLEVVLDNQPYTMVYDLNQPLVLKDLDAGSHTLRAFASRPWHESFKNEGAYAQVTFHVGAKTGTNTPDPKLPLLTYSRPTGSYGAEPIMLDFYLTNAPLHLVAQTSSDDDIPDWRIRATINGQSFVFDRWQPIYLKGFQPGKNWVKLEFLDETGEPVQNQFNTTARLITYEPNGIDSFSKLIRGELPLAEARRMIDPNYMPASPVAAPATPSPSAPSAPVTSLPSSAPATESVPTPKPAATPAPEQASPLLAPTIAPSSEAVAPEPAVTSPTETLESQLDSGKPEAKPVEPALAPTEPLVAPSPTPQMAPQAEPSGEAPPPTVMAPPTPQPEVAEPVSPTNPDVATPSGVVESKPMVDVAPVDATPSLSSEQLPSAPVPATPVPTTSPAA